jgi:hypothetical protein
MAGNGPLVVNWGLAGIDVACFGVFRGVICQEMVHVTSDGLTRDPKNVTRSFKTEKSLGYDLLPWDQPRDSFSLYCDIVKSCHEDKIFSNPY